ncbi:energy transducer TonB [Sphingomonas sp. FW199]|uniref:energy transducer TonB n=1 Tax=Sphingomonas sp. BGYR3 TaxID=2975483 RepID=UPI0021A36F03|nr:energy transducer TonB [Sphingomonas sp. BGYR3]MDG5487081.1 energy transducer TonB [Sphingomonas sp. BGYR3]
MAYADRDTGGSRIVAIVTVSILMAILGYAFITGLATKFVKEAATELDVFEVAEPPPPPEEVPPPPPEQPQQVTQPPPVVTPPPIVQTNTPPPNIIQSVTTPPPNYAPVPVAAPPVPAAPVAPPVPKPVVSKAAGAKGDPSKWVTTDDYPARSLDSGEEGVTAISWDINEAGRVENCRVTSSSGSSALDRAACSAITRRGRYEPAKDQNGNPIRSSSSRRVVWKIPQ